MDPDRWRRIEELCHAAAGREGAERAAFLDQACGDDLELRQEVESLLAEQTGAEKFLETPALQAAALTPGTRLSHYEIGALVGAGGMGEVYRARDTTLDRVVALKVLPAAVAHDAGRRLRFEREAKAVAALNHPNIVTIHSVEEAEGLHFLTMELVGGETVRERTPRQGLALDALLDVAIPLADAVSAAHEAGIVHRDLKPDNVMLTPEGRLKVLDFGLAKLRPVAAGSENTTMPASGETGAGHIVGTVAYMAPEQAEGKAVDARTDVFAIGVMLYEMATGERPFTGETGIAVMSAILRHTPPRVTDLRPELPRDLAKIVQRCLAKDPERRYQTAKDVRNELTVLKEDLASGEAFAPTAVSPSRSSRPWRAVAMVVGVVAIAFASWWGLTLRPEPPPMRTTPLTSDQRPEAGPALSPDGTWIAFTKIGEAGTRDLYVKQTDGREARAIVSGGVRTPAWSPDGQRIAFLRQVGGEDEQAILQVDLLGNDYPPLGTFRGRAALAGLAWSPDGKYLAVARQDTPQGPGAIYLVDIDAGDQIKLTTPPAEYVVGDYDPRFSPDGQTVAFVRSPGRAGTDVWAAAVSGPNKGEAWRLTSGNGNTLGLDWAPDGRSVVFSASRGGREGLWSLWRVSVSEGEEGEPERLEVGDHGTYPTASREDGRLAYVSVNENYDIWRVGGPSAAPEERNAPAPLIESPGLNYFPRFSPDGQKIAFTSSRTGNSEIWVCDSDGSNPQRLTLLEAPLTKNASWSPDGQSVVFDSGREAAPDIYSMSLTERFPRPIIEWPDYESAAHYSGDGGSIYFHSTRTGQRDVWKIPAAGGQATQVTQTGAVLSWESPDRQFLYFTKRRGWGPLSRIPIDGGEEVAVLPDVNINYVSVFNKGICFVSRSPRPAIDCLDFDTGQVNSVADFPDEAFAVGLSVSPDGRWILYSRNLSSSDIWLVENFR